MASPSDVVQQGKIQIYSPSNDEVSAFWRDKYEKDAKKYWDIFYKRHQDKFFKDRHYLEKEWGHHFSEEGTRAILEVGCGAGNTIFPLLAAYPDIFVHACDFSPRAVNLVKMHKDFTEARVNAFVSDLTVDDLSMHLAPSSVDIITMMFVLSAVSPEKMPTVVQNIRKVLKPNGRILFRDYAIGDLAQERFTGKEQKISENFYVRGDGTRAFYFADEFLRNLFEENGFSMVEHVLCCKQVENRSRELVMNRRWVQAVFQLADTKCISGAKTKDESLHLQEGCERKDDVNGFEIDISDGVAVEMFGISSSSEEIIEISIRDYFFKIKVLSKEYQHTCPSTGLMLWESARLMASVLAANQEITSGKRVLELGCGCAGVCSMIAVGSADLVVATDGDTKALDLLTQNVASNVKPQFLDSLHVKRLEWGNEDDTEAIKKLSDKGFDIIIGTDVTYVKEAIIPLFATARALISTGVSGESNKDRGLILCHVLRRVDEARILSAAARYGFKLVERWPESDETLNSSYGGGIIKNWLSNCQYEVPSTALNIMYFHIA
ncbi:hypothetical protein ACP275_01G011500 [Erythranthe tilingii]